MTGNTTSYTKSYEELEYRDDFMFGKVMEDTDLCREVLECLLDEPIGTLTHVETQREIRYTSDGKPIRLDMYTGNASAVYDAEMQNKGHQSLRQLELAKRTRFYQASIDTDAMNKSESYAILPDSYVIFICTFDPFGRGLSRYTFRSRCDESPDMILGDNTYKIFYNCSYTGDDISKELREYYRFVMEGVPADSGLTHRLADAIHKARLNEEWRSGYMKERILFMDMRNEGREEGREELLVEKICKKLKKGKSVETIADELEETVERIEDICKVATSFAPDYDVEKIIEAMNEETMTV